MSGVFEEKRYKMNWRQKSDIQNVIAKLPLGISYAAYYFVQRNWGGLRNINPINGLTAGIKVVQYIRQQGHLLEAKTFLEIGTGRRLNLPIVLWLCGASKIITVDLNPYLKSELVFEDIAYIRNNQQEIKALFAEESQTAAWKERFARLLGTENNLQRLLAVMDIRYLAPADASCLALESENVDYHVSLDTLEHIPPETIGRIFKEGRRVLKQKGLFVHGIDFSDHFSHSDNSISGVNFLQFTENEWRKLAGNRYMYQNRLRIDDMADLFQKANLDILTADAKIDTEVLERLKNGFMLDERFKSKSIDVNATTRAWIVASVCEKM